MKKQYIKPSITVVSVDTEGDMLRASNVVDRSNKIDLPTSTASRKAIKAACGPARRTTAAFGKTTNTKRRDLGKVYYNHHKL